jgi:NADPH-dependent glutamate synthase beta subunit-like oxidoreductase
MPKRASSKRRKINMKRFTEIGYGNGAMDVAIFTRKTR